MVLWHLVSYGEDCLIPVDITVNSFLVEFSSFYQEKSCNNQKNRREQLSASLSGTGKQIVFLYSQHILLFLITDCIVFCLSCSYNNFNCTVFRVPLQNEITPGALMCCQTTTDMTNCDSDA